MFIHSLNGTCTTIHTPTAAHTQTNIYISNKKLSLLPQSFSYNNIPYDSAMYVFELSRWVAKKKFEILCFSCSLFMINGLMVNLRQRLNCYSKTQHRISPH